MAIITFPRFDWFAVLACLNHHGLSNAEVARQTGVHDDRIDRIKTGTEPRYGDGGRLLRLHARHCNTEHLQPDLRPADANSAISRTLST